MAAATEQPASSPLKWLAWGAIAAIDLILLYGVTLMYAQGETAFALVIVLVVCSGTWVFISAKGYNYRYVYPAILGVSTFIVFPLIYTVNVAFTNYSSNNLLPLERVKEILLSKTYRIEGESYPFKVFQSDNQYRVVFIPSETEFLVSQPFTEESEPALISAKLQNTIPDGKELAFRETIKLRQLLKTQDVKLPSGLQLSMISLRKFGPMVDIYRDIGGNILQDVRNGNRLIPDFSVGYFKEVPAYFEGELSEAESVGPGFVVYSGWDNFTRVITDPGIQGPFLQIFIWTTLFSLLSVIFTLIIGLLMACLVQWEPLKGNGVYRLLLILPYAVPAFISILIFRGLFNQNFGEINMLLNLLFGIEPEWFSNEFLAKTMVVIVNTWLGYPYMMILCIGLLKAIPGDLYEASAIDGATPWQNLTRITVPLIIKPLIPLLIASFAFNFNNLVLIALLTGGGPNIIGATVPAGATDILVSYTFRMAFGQYGQDYGLASAIATFIFLIVGTIAWVNLRVTKRMVE
ncbi:maltose ABC transporter permease MalF [Endozoicomonas sp. OPT23]|uniref:maltose ABC transporter permease MalF n=1 Tax=Endozoicomonas sp. OPT23 TaxID=2072845 RepID=UPI00129BEF56|nr:maltose ABC transporter permease MalF [Endozoicomonas sp. OPT23]MRI31892.1 maltose ABC transporter permease MalF [Endozoicomonas sp. OPT23]